MAESGLYGLDNSNRDFTKKENWGKNKFNSSFPASLVCYMDSKSINPIYLRIDASAGNNLRVVKNHIHSKALLGISSTTNVSDVYYEFEGLYAPHSYFDEEEPPRNDLVVREADGEEYYTGLEVKLTTVPDNSTCDLTEEEYGCELVIRSVSIIHLAISIAELYEKNREDLSLILNPITSDISDWNDEKQIIPKVSKMIEALNKIIFNNISKQSPLILNPIWKTNGKSSGLADNCLDVFVWSNFAFTRLFVDSIKIETLISTQKINRYARSLIWLIRLLDDYSKRGKMNSKVINGMPFDAQTDKAFAITGKKTHRYMRCKELVTPRITREEIKHIILGEGSLFLSPERRFDAAIVYAPDIFSTETQEE